MGIDVSCEHRQMMKGRYLQMVTSQRLFHVSPGSVLQQELHDTMMSFQRCFLEWRAALVVQRMDISAALDQQLYRPKVSCSRS